MSGPTRADIADALVEMVEADDHLLFAIAIQEAWHSGFIGRLLAHAEVLVAQSMSTEFLVSEPMDPLEAARRAANILDTRYTLEIWKSAVDVPARDAALEFLRAQARFHRTAAALERRGLRRTPPPG